MAALSRQNCQSPLANAINSRKQFHNFTWSECLTQRTPIVGLEMQRNERMAYEDQFLWLWGRDDHQGSLVIGIAATLRDVHKIGFVGPPAKG